MLISYVNGKYFKNPSIFDRGLQFADSFYSVFLIIQNKIIDEKVHFYNLQDTAQKLGFNELDITDIKNNLQTLLKKNNLQDASVYIQISRGGNGNYREYLPKPLNSKPNIIISVTPFNLEPFPNELQQVTLLCLPDTRHKLVNFKTTNLLATIMGKQQAKNQKLDEVLFIKSTKSPETNDDENGSNGAVTDFFITECGSSNIFIIDSNNVIKTPPSNGSIYNGITRQRIINIVENELTNYQIQYNKNLYKQDLMDAQAIFTTASKSLIAQVALIKHDDQILYENSLDNDIVKQIAEHYNNFIHNIITK